MVFCESGNDLRRTRQVFLQVLSACYGIAFVSIYLQIPGLYGPDGIVPAAPEVSKHTTLSLTDPHLLWLAPKLELSADGLLDLLCLVGALLATLGAVFPAVCCKPLFLLLFLNYRSVFKVGHVFLWFQWDILLLEVGFLALVVAPMSCSFGRASLREYRPHDHICMMLVRWLLFRMMFASGVVKLQSNCPTWWGLTAMPLHYESQCIPTPLAWYAYNFDSPFLHKLSVVGTYLIEIPLTFLFFAPLQGLRKLTFTFQVLLMILIMSTGNYNFFNLLYIALCLSLVDDGWLPARTWLKKSGWLVTLFIGISNLAAFASLTFAFCFYFFTPEMDPKIQFSRKTFDLAVAEATTAGIYLGAMSLVSSVFISLRKSLFPSDDVARLYRNHLQDKFWRVAKTAVYSSVALLLFLASVPVFTRGVQQPVPDFVKSADDSLPFKSLKRHVLQWDVVHSYGLFRTMTGVGGRPELIIEGSPSYSGPWEEYQFLYKPGNVSAAPRYCLPHQPRLDWQMWFAALGKYHHNPWLLSLACRILQHKIPVLNLMDYQSNPFKEKPPKFLRMKLYLYHFTGPTNAKGQGGWFASKPASDERSWWYREEEGIYLPPISLDGSDTIKQLTDIGIMVDERAFPKTTNPILGPCLTLVRETASQVQPHVIVWTLGAMTIISILSGLFKPPHDLVS